MICNLPEIDEARGSALRLSHGAAAVGVDCTKYRIVLASPFKRSWIEVNDVWRHTSQALRLTTDSGESFYSTITTA